MIKFFIEPGYDVKAPMREYGNAGVDVFIPTATDAFVKAFNDKNLTENAVLDFNEEGKPVIKIMPHGRSISKSMAIPPRPHCLCACGTTRVA